MTAPRREGKPICVQALLTPAIGQPDHRDTRVVSRFDHGLGAARHKPWLGRDSRRLLEDERCRGQQPARISLTRVWIGRRS